MPYDPVQHRPDVLMQLQTLGRRQLHSLTPIADRRSISSRITERAGHMARVRAHDERAAAAAAPQLPMVVIANALRIAQTVVTIQEGVKQSSSAFTLQANQQLNLSPAKPLRRYLLIQNNTGGPLFYAVGRPATSQDTQIPISGNYEPAVVPTGSVNVFSQVGGSGTIIEG